MKTTIKTLKRMMLVALFTLISSSAFAATYYVCAGATLNFTPQTIANISYTWDVAGGGFNTITPVAGVYSIPASSTPGTYTVTMRSTSSNPAICAPADVVNDFIVLPPLAFNLASAPSNAQYCTSAGVNANSVITPTFTGFPTGTPYTNDLEAEYSYSVVKDGGSPVNGTTVGSINATTGVYTLTTTVIGTYVITGSVKYKQKIGFTNALISTSGCPVTGATTQTVEVIAAPSQPTILITAN